MLTQEQRVKIQAIYDGASIRINRFLAHFQIVGDELLETSTFLCALSGVSFPGHTEEIADTIGGVLLLYSTEEPAVKHRLRLYGAVADNTIQPFGFWSPISVDALCGDPIARMVAVYGDLLVHPECADDYSSCRWPLFSRQDLAVFSMIFITRVVPEVNRYLKAVECVLKEKPKEE